jgi:hypothetical protein
MNALAFTREVLAVFGEPPGSKYLLASVESLMLALAMKKSVVCCSQCRPNRAAFRAAGFLVRTGRSEKGALHDPN